MKNISKIISVISLSVSITLLFYVYFKSEVINSGLNSGYYTIYYFVIFFMILISIISFFINDEIKMNFSIIIFSSLFALYLVEAHFFLKSSHYQILKSDVKFDIRHKHVFYTDYKKMNPEVVVSVSPERFIFEKNQSLMPLSGISKKETILCNETGNYSLFKSDRYGFRNPDEVWEIKNDAILLIGDSFAMGSCVNDLNTISANLRNLIKTNNIINMGYSGDGPLIEYATLREYLPLTNVKKIIWFYYEGNDLADLERSLNNDILKKYLKNINFSQNLKTKQSLLNKKIYNMIDIRLKEKLKSQSQELNIDFLPSFKLNALIFQNFFKLYNVRNLLKDSFSQKKIIKPFVKNIDPNFKKILSLTKELTEKNDAKLYFVYLPEFKRYRSRNSIKLNNYNEIEYKKILEIINNLNIPIINIHQELFRKYKDPLNFFPFRSPYHYTEEMYKMIAETINNKFINE